MEQVPLNAHRLKEGFEQFNAAREPGEIDLVVEVRERLITALVPHGRGLEGFDDDELIIEAKNKQCNIQRWLLNRYWVRQFGLCQVDSMDIRIYLVQNGTEEDWLKLFSHFVLPFAVANGLPTKTLV